MSWIQTYTGRRVDVIAGLLSDDVDITIEDIAHALSMQCRFGGHCVEFYSVAQHSVHVAEVVSDWMNEPTLMLEALLHDAAEAYLLDLPRPIKHAPALAEYRALDKRVDQAVRARFGLPLTMSAEVKEADEIMLATEAQRLMKHKPNGWELRAQPIPKPLSPWTPREAKTAFLTMFGIASAQHAKDGAK